jgi:CO/xanthine dehydrogenase FAD-binding subunit
MPVYLQPDNLDDAVAALARQSLTIVAGGTDY